MTAGTDRRGLGEFLLKCQRDQRSEQRIVVDHKNSRSVRHHLPQASKLLPQSRGRLAQRKLSVRGSVLIESFEHFIDRTEDFQSAICQLRRVLGVDCGIRRFIMIGL